MKKKPVLISKQKGYNKLTLDQKIKACMLTGWMLDRNMNIRESNVQTVKWMDRHKEIIVVVDLFAYIRDAKVSHFDVLPSIFQCKKEKIQVIGVMDSWIVHYNRQLIEDFLDKAFPRNWAFMYDKRGARAPDIIKTIADESYTLGKRVITVCNDLRFGPMNDERCHCLTTTFNLIPKAQQYFKTVEDLQLSLCLDKHKVFRWIDTLVQYGLYD